MDVKNFLFVSFEGLATDLAWQVKKEGHNVKFYIKNEDVKTIGNGFFPKTDNWEEEVTWANVIVFDDVLGQGEVAKKLRAQGKKVIGGTPYTDRLEDDRGFGQEELKKHDIKILSYNTFTSFDEAIEFVKTNPGRYVFKPSGEAQNAKGLLFVGEENDGSDMIQVLDDYKKTQADRIETFQLQKRITGIEVGVGAFFNGKEFIYPVYVGFEHKKFFTGELGPSTPEMGTLGFWSGPNRLFNMTLKKFEQTLANEGYVGYIDLNFMVNEDGIYPLEWTVRFGYPLICLQQESFISPTGEFLYALANGESYKLQVKNGFQIGVRLVVPPFPFNDKKTFDLQSKDIVVFFKNAYRDKLSGLHIEDVKLVNEKWVVTGYSGVVFVICGTALTVKQAQTLTYNRIKNINIPHMYYRTDIGDRWNEDSDRLHNWGYLREV